MHLQKDPLSATAGLCEREQPNRQSSAKRLLVLTERFAPEEFLINDLAKEWVRQGYEVEVLTQVPSYPHDKIFDGYRNKLYQTTEELGDCRVRVHRVRTVLGYNASVKRKILNYISFAFWTFGWALLRGWKYDRVFIYHTGPLTMATAVLPLRWLWWRKCILWTQDLWPEAVYAYGIRKTAFRNALLNWFIRRIYKACRTVLVSCPGFVETLSQRIKKPVTFIPQWDLSGTELPPKASSQPPYVFMFTGNHGVPQILDRVILGFARAQLPNAELHLVGGGVKLESLQALVAEQKIPNVIFHGRQPHHTMPDFLSRADVLLLPLASEFALTLPGKFPAYLKAGRPILGIIEGEAAHLITHEDLGLVASPSDTEAIAQAFTQLTTLLAEDPEQIARYRQHCLDLSRGQFDRTHAIERLTEALGIPSTSPRSTSEDQNI